jgi:hypothetical protein
MSMPLYIVEQVSASLFDRIALAAIALVRMADTAQTVSEEKTIRTTQLAELYKSGARNHCRCRSKRGTGRLVGRRRRNRFTQVA